MLHVNDQTKAKKIIAVIACLFTGYFCLYLLTAPEKLPEGDEGIMLGVANRIAQHGFSNRLTKLGTETFSSYGFFRGGFSKYGLGQSLIMIPVVSAFKSAKQAVDAQGYYSSLLAIYSLSALLGALINILFFLTCLRLGYAINISFCLTLILGTTTMVWPYSQTLFSDPTLGLMWLLALYALLSFKATRKPFWLSIAGGAIGFAVLTKIVAAYTVPIFGAYFLYLVVSENRVSGKGKLIAGLFKLSAWFLSPLIVFGCVVLWYNHLRYGKYLTFGYLDYNTYDIRDSMFGFNVPFLTGLYGQLLSSGKGFFFYSPSALLAFWGWKQFYKRNRAEALVVLSVICGMLMIYSTWYGWHGDWSWGPRYLSCLPPFFILASGPCLENIFNRWKHRQKGYPWAAGLISLLLAVSFAVQILGLCINNKNYIQIVYRVGVFQEPSFTADWPIRDDSLQLHFIPEFSPLAGHLWMMRVLSHRLDARSVEIFKSPPWKELNALWIPEKISPSFFRYNIWWLHAQAAGLPGAEGTVFPAFFLFSISILAFATGLYAALKTRPPPLGNVVAEP